MATPTQYDKLKLDRRNLEERRIFYFEHDSTGDDYQSFRKRVRAKAPELELWQPPSHVDWLRELLLDSSGLLPSYAKDHFKSELNSIPPGVIFEDDDYKNYSPEEQSFAKERFRRIICDAREIAGRARSNLKDKASEHDWQSFMESDIFKRYRERKATLFKPTGSDAILDSYETCCNVLWKNSRSVAAMENKSDLVSVLPDPKPDVFFGFPIYRPVQQPATGLRRSALVRNFTLEKMAALSKKGLACSPTTDIAKYGSYNHVEDIPRNDLICFPFAIIELKHGSVRGSQMEFCCCQAANGASRALTMLEKLYRFADPQQNGFHVPPVVTFTCIGPTVRLWIAYSICPSGYQPVHIMQCIRCIEVTSTWAVLEIHSIIANLLCWATRVLRPNISTQLSRWRLRKNDMTCDTGQMWVDPAREILDFLERRHADDMAQEGVRLLVRSDILEKLLEERNEMLQAFAELPIPGVEAAVKEREETRRKRNKGLQYWTREPHEERDETLRVSLQKAAHRLRPRDLATANPSVSLNEQDQTFTDVLRTPDIEKLEIRDHGRLQPKPTISGLDKDSSKKTPAENRYRQRLLAAFNNEPLGQLKDLRRAPSPKRSATSEQLPTNKKHKGADETTEDPIIPCGTQ